MEERKIIMLALEELHKNHLRLHRTSEENGTVYCGSYHTVEVTYKGHDYNLDFHRHRWEEPNGEVRAPKKMGQIKVIPQDTILSNGTIWLEVYY